MSNSNLEDLIERQGEQIKLLTEAVERQNELIEAQNRLVERIADVLVPAAQVTKVLDLNKGTIGKNKKITKYQPIGQNRNYIKLGEVAFIQNRKTKVERRKFRQR